MRLSKHDLSMKFISKGLTKNLSGK